MKKLLSVMLILCVFTVAATSVANAQTTGQLELGLSRDFGYGGFGNDIQGLFSLRVKNPPQNLTKVEFFIDTNSMGVVAAAPFSLQFNTDSYPLGAHTLSAIGYTSDGKQLASNKITTQFVSAGTGTSMVFKIVLPIIGLVVLMIIISVALPLVINKGKVSSMPLGTARKYGFGGGAICPKCGRPFPLRLWWLNLGLSKIDRCPFCGKWSLVRPSSLSELHAAEVAELSQSQPGIVVEGESEAEKLRKELDDSRFQDT